ncbi:MAG: hypothetical protein OJF50_001370 [Nitrospira sp.]|jgi:hypothetical protein|nr:hypothetical protein [Nitrospira sp.]
MRREFGVLKSRHHQVQGKTALVLPKHNYRDSLVSVSTVDTPRRKEKQSKPKRSSGINQDGELLRKILPSHLSMPELQILPSKRRMVSLTALLYSFVAIIYVRIYNSISQKRTTRT